MTTRGLTVKEVEALRFERDGHRVADRDGLYVRLSEAGGKSYQFRATVGAARPWVTLGSCDALSLAAARELGARVRELLRANVSLARIRAALAVSHSARTLEAHLPADGERGEQNQTRGAARAGTSGESFRSEVPLADLQWVGGAKGRGWVRISTDEAVAFPTRTRSLAKAPHGTANGGQGAPQEPTRPFAGLTSTSTVHEAVVAWFEWKRHGLKNGKHADQNWNTMATYVLPSLGARSLSSVRRRDVMDLLWPIWHAKPETASRVQGRLREVFELAVAEELREDNPAAFDADVSLGRVRKTTKHHESLPHHDVQEFWTWLLTTPCTETTRAVLRLVLLTARRTGEARFAVWSDFDLGGLSWDELAHIMESRKHGDPAPAVVWGTPAERMKMARAYRTPLSRQAVQVLLHLRRLAPAGVAGQDYVFASNTRSGTLSENTGLKHIKTFRDGLTVHGLRSTFRTWGSDERWDTDLLEFSLAHVQEKLEAAYQRSDLLEQRRPLMQAWADVVTRGRDVPEPGYATQDDEAETAAEEALASAA